MDFELIRRQAQRTATQTLEQYQIQQTKLEKDCRLDGFAWHPDEDPGRLDLDLEFFLKPNDQAALEAAAQIAFAIDRDLRSDDYGRLKTASVFQFPEQGELALNITINVPC